MIKGLALVLLFLLPNCFASRGQKNKNLNSKVVISKADSSQAKKFQIVVDSIPQYPGGDSEFRNFFLKNYNYPDGIDACCTINVEFIIDTTGRMTNIKILKGLQELIDNEAIRVLNLMPLWKPGINKGTKVPVKLFYPLRIEIQ